jgi:hypothetical protein
VAATLAITSAVSHIIDDIFLGNCKIGYYRSESVGRVCCSLQRGWHASSWQFNRPRSWGLLPFHCTENTTNPLILLTPMAATDKLVERNIKRLCSPFHMLSRKIFRSRCLKTTLPPSCFNVLRNILPVCP